MNFSTISRFCKVSSKQTRSQSQSQSSGWSGVRCSECHQNEAWAPSVTDACDRFLLLRLLLRDNLEFLQWIKKYWDTTYPGTPYDPDARRAGAAAAPPPLIGATTVGAARGTAARPSAATTSAPTRRPAAAPAARPAAGRGAGGVPAGHQAVPQETINALTSEMEDMKVSVDTLEKERDFYFSKVSRSQHTNAGYTQRGIQTDQIAFHSCATLKSSSMSVWNW